MTTMNQSHHARTSRIHWQHIEPTLIEYQEAVAFDRVMSEHRAAVGAEPMETEASTNVRLIQGPCTPKPSRVIATPTFL